MDAGGKEDTCADVKGEGITGVVAKLIFTICLICY